MNARTKPPQQLAALTIGFNSYLMPPEVALKVMGLMSKAVECERDVSRNSIDWTYLVGSTPRLEMSIVTAKQVRVKATHEPETHHPELIGRTQP